MNARPPSLAAIMAAALFALSCFGATLFVWRSFGGPSPLAPEGYRFHVLLRPGGDAHPERRRAHLRRVGGQGHQGDARGLRTDAEIELERRTRRCPGTPAILRSKTLLGETFVELTPGNRTRPKLPEGGSCRSPGGGDAGPRPGAQRLRRAHPAGLQELPARPLGSLDGRDRTSRTRSPAPAWPPTSYVTWSWRWTPSRTACAGWCATPAWCSARWDGARPTSRA